MMILLTLIEGENKKKHDRGRLSGTKKCIYIGEKGTVLKLRGVQTLCLAAELAAKQGAQLAKMKKLFRLYRI